MNTKKTGSKPFFSFLSIGLITILFFILILLSTGVCGAEEQAPMDLPETEPTPPAIDAPESMTVPKRFHAALTGNWSVLSLLLSAAAVLTAMMQLINPRGREERKRRGRVLYVLLGLTGFLTPAVWLLFDNLRLAAGWINRTTLLVLAAFLLHAAALLSYRHRTRDTQ
ncbi:MAG: hypothetical protein LBR14_02010 [Clostridiales Family XIII bacterium]|jgi:hypothetical protein|nr:hypothetical protein [Clostridiales Family XIII bacterium]